MADSKKRRDFLTQAGTLWGSTFLASHIPVLALAADTAMARGQGFTVLTPAEAADFEAIAARIIPTSDTPGAREAGAVWFIDQALADTFSDALPALRRGLAALQADAGSPFADLDAAAQDALLRRQEESEFFGFVRFLTVAGTFAMSSHGGNRNHIGWQILEFDHRHAWNPPFGHYDADIDVDIKDVPGDGQ